MVRVANAPAFYVVATPHQVRMLDTSGRLLRKDVCCGASHAVIGNNMIAVYTKPTPGTERRGYCRDARAIHLAPGDAGHTAPTLNGSLYKCVYTRYCTKGEAANVREKARLPRIKAHRRKGR